MATPYNKISPEVIQAMLGLSEQDQEKKLLEKQLYMSNMLGNQALDYRGQASGAGGFFSALAQGAAGYGAGKQLQAYDTGTIKGMEKRKGQRKLYIDSIIGASGGDEAGQAMPPIPAPVSTQRGAMGNMPPPLPGQSIAPQPPPTAPMPQQPANMVPGGAMPAESAITMADQPIIGKPGTGMPPDIQGNKLPVIPPSLSPYKSPYTRRNPREEEMARFLMEHRGGL